MTARLRRAPHLVDFALRFLAPLFGIGAFALTWQLVALHNPDVIPRIGAIWSALRTSPSQYGSNAWVTTEEALVGLSVSFVLAFFLAVAMTELRLVERAVMPLAVVLNVTPVVALAPALLIGFGTNAPRFIVTAIIVFFPLLVNSLMGLRSIEPEALEYFQTLNASRFEVLAKLRLPSSLPFLFAAARIGFPLGVVGAVVAEFTTGVSGRGLGSLIFADLQYGPDELGPAFAGIFCLALLGLVFTFIVRLAERWLCAWHPTTALMR